MADVVVSSYWRDRPTLVTGAAGFVGQWLTGSLVDAGASVVCIVRDELPPVPGSPGLARSTVVRGDVRDQALVERALGEYEIDTVFHLAAQTVVRIANRNPASTLDSNIRGTWTVLEACRRSPTVKRIVAASSDKAYGAHASLPYTEATPLEGRFPYDVSKSAADLIVQAYAMTYDLPVAISRCANIYGGGDLNWSRLIPGVVRSVLRGEDPVVRSDGTFLRDYIYVDDAVAAYLRLAEQVDQGVGVKGSAFNFGQNAPLSVIEVVHRILTVAQRADLTPQIESRTTHEIPQQYLNSEKAAQVLDWRPTVDFDEGLARTIDWYRRHLEAAPS